MTDAAVPTPEAGPARTTRGAFVVAVLLSAALVFTVQPLTGRLLLPILGGAPAVWAVSLAFFQAALLAGYAYAHLLQRLRPLIGQAAVHVAVLIAAGVVSLPLRVEHGLGDPSDAAPAGWLVLQLMLTVGAPFAALSATAPLLQAWFARTQPGRNPYGLYVASNVGSLGALLAYPLLIEPFSALTDQRWAWSVGYGSFVALAVLLAFRLRDAARPSAAAAPRPAPLSWRRRLSWLLLSAAPSSLLIGLTTHLATDVASAPFLWVPPLALYLFTFVVAFQRKPWIRRRTALFIQAAAVPTAAVLLPFPTTLWPALAASHLAAFFGTALVCHQALAARKPSTPRLTEFYFWIALGGVLGGAFNAFAAPTLFERVWEYPIVLVLAALARPWGRGRPPWWMLGTLALTIAASAVVGVSQPEDGAPGLIARLALAVSCASMVVLARRAWLFVIALACVFVAGERLADREGFVMAERSFFGVHRIADQQDPGLGPVRTLFNGTTLHGAQALAPARRCEPLTYYGPRGPIGEVLRTYQRGGRPVSVAVVGLGTGSLAAYGRAGDRMRFFEIDPTTARLAGPDGWFTYLSRCSRSRNDTVLGDARLSLRREPSATYHVMVVDAFSSDTVPTHLLTREAMAEYLRVLRPGGAVVLHLSNRNLALTPFAAAGARAAGGSPIVRVHLSDPRGSQLAESSSEVMVVGATSQAASRIAANGGWSVPPPNARPWTDDQTAVIEALWRRFAG